MLCLLTSHRCLSGTGSALHVLQNLGDGRIAENLANRNTAEDKRTAECEQQFSLPVAVVEERSVAAGGKANLLDLGI